MGSIEKPYIHSSIYRGTIFKHEYCFIPCAPNGVHTRKSYCSSSESHQNQYQFYSPHMLPLPFNNPIDFLLQVINMPPPSTFIMNIIILRRCTTCHAGSIDHYCRFCEENCGTRLSIMDNNRLISSLPYEDVMEK